MGKDKQFIIDLVNTVYGIILGFGFVEIIRGIFSNKIALSFSPSNPIFFQMVMALFVIIVVCLYWWDWSENIETKVKTTFPEFFIDMGILFMLLMILFNFDDPLTLIILFFILSTWDLLWAINFLREFSEGKIFSFWKIEGIINFIREFRKDRMKLIEKKILALILYGLAWYIMYIISEYESYKNISGGMFLISMPLFVSFILVRLFCFRNRLVDR